MRKILLSLLLLTHFVFASNVVPDASITAVKLGAPAPYDAINYILTASIATNALTIALKTNAGTNPTGRDVSKIAFRSATSSSGVLNERSITGALSIVIPSGTTIGTTSANAATIYVYAMDNAGTVVLAVSMSQFSDGTVQSSTAISGGATSSTLYSTAGQSSLPIRLLGKITVTEATAGTWATAPSLIQNISSISTPLNIADSGGFVFSTTSTSSTTVTGSSVSITTSGRPVIINFVPDVSGTATQLITGLSWTSVTANTRITGNQIISVLRDSVTGVGGSPTLSMSMYTGSSTSAGFFQFPQTIEWIDRLVTAGTHTYVLFTAAQNAANLTGLTAFMSGSLVVYEMPPN